MTTTAYPSGGSATASAALWSLSATIVLASFTHARDFGVIAFVTGAVLIAVLLLLAGYQRRTGSWLTLLLWGLLELWVIGGFGFFGGFWNHAVKVAVSALNGGVLPPSWEPLFMSPDLGNLAYETAGILTFGASVLAAFFGYRYARALRATSGGAGQGAVGSAASAADQATL